MTLFDTISNLIVNNNNDNNNNKTSVIVKSAVIISSLALCFYSYYYLNQSEEANALQPAVTEDEAKKIMKSIMDKLIILQPKLLGALKNIKMQIESSGQEIEDSIIMKQYILPHLNTQLLDIQTAVYEEYNVDEDEVEEAVNTYIKKGDAELTTIHKKIRSMYRTFGGDIDDDDDDEVVDDVEDKDDDDDNNNDNTSKSKNTVNKIRGNKKRGPRVGEMNMNQLVLLLEELTTQLLASSDDYCGSFIEKHGIPSNKMEFDQFQMGLLTISQAIEKSILDQAGISEIEFQKILMKNQSNKKIQEIFLNMQIENGKLLQRHGISIEG